MRMRLGVLCLLGGLAALVGCEPGREVETVYVDRSGCLACHRPLQPDGSELGIEEAHPLVDGRALSCTDCHGGDAESRKQSEAHVQPLLGTPRFLKDLTVGELDLVEPEYLRFVNPGDLRAAPMSCGAGSPAAGGGGCHQEVIDKIALTPMATASGDLGVARYRAGSQRSALATKGLKDARDDFFEAGEVPGAVPSLAAMTDPRVSTREDQIGPYQDLVLSKECASCHLWTFGQNQNPGDYRSSGCSACHMVYAEDGVSRSQDPTAPEAAPHPERHALTAAPPTAQCERCHFEGARIGLSFQGLREAPADGLAPPSPGFLGRALHGHEVGFYYTDEETRNDVDETPPDVHFERGMHCIDCHLGDELHGDGRIHSSGQTAVKISCEDCHGDADRETSLTTSDGTPLKALSRGDDGQVWLKGKVDGAMHPVTQVKRELERGSPGAQAHARDGDGFTHLDSLECYTCHSAWAPTCMGCHVSVDMREVQASQLTGRSLPGSVRSERGWVETDLLLLMLNVEGKISPSMPSERVFFSVTDGSGDTVLERAPRVGANGAPGMGHRAIHPHTVQAKSPWSACDRCHPVEGTGANLPQVMQTLGFGSDQFLFEDGAGQVWALDRLITPDTYEPTVLVGHDEPRESRPLTSDTIQRVLGVEVRAP
jgi:hypothetical protein